MIGLDCYVYFMFSMLDGIKIRLRILEGLWEYVYYVLIGKFRGYLKFMF